MSKRLAEEINRLIKAGVIPPLLMIAGFSLGIAGVHRASDLVLAVAFGWLLRSVIEWPRA